MLHYLKTSKTQYKDTIEPRVIITDLELEILEETAERVLTIKIIHISNKEIVLLF